MYVVIIYSLRRCLTVPNTGNSRIFNDIASCEHYSCLYIADDDDGDDMSVFIHRLLRKSSI